MARKRDTNIFSLSFLDIMSCGFGAVILIYIIINHATVTTSQELNAQLLAEVKKFEIDVKDETENLIILRNTAEEQEDERLVQDNLQTIRDIGQVKVLGRLQRHQSEADAKHTFKPVGQAIWDQLLR